MKYQIHEILSLLQRFPQGAYLTSIGDRGIEDLRVWVLEEEWQDNGNGYYKLDTPDNEMPWKKLDLLYY
jgi:hypothetical protein